MRTSNDKLWHLAALIPAGICFGPLFLSNGWGPWLLMAGLVCMFVYTTRLHRRIAVLEQQIKEQNTSNTTQAKMAEPSD
ncbi:MAG: hypothetical protein JJU29_00790 [Verrucomicrobia bacterium]|nr:hypothetical protein [Verrucomicrobiota bacterium]